MAEPRFVITIVPNGIGEGQFPDRLKVSVCIELNRDDPTIVNKDNPSPVKIPWNEIADELRKPGCFTINGLAEVCAVVDPAQAPGATTVNLWNRFMVPSVTAGSQPPAAETRLDGRAGAGLVSQRTTSSAQGATLSSPVALLRELRESSHVGGIMALSKDLVLGLGRAWDTHQSKIRYRLDRGRASRLSRHPVLTQGAQREIDLRLSDLDMIAESFAATPEYVYKAWDLLNSSPGLRRFFGTTIDVILRLVADGVPLLPEIKAHHPDGKFKVGIREFGDHYRASSTGMKIVPFGAKLERLMGYGSPAYETFFENSMMLLSTRSRVLSIDPQMAAKAAEDAAEELVKLPFSLRGPVQQWRLPVERARLRRETSTADGASRIEPARTALATIIEDRQRLESLHRVHNQVTNIPSTGHAVHLTDKGYQAPLPPDPHAPLPPIEEFGLTRGFAVYARAVVGDQPGPWMSLTRVAEEVKWQGRRPQPLEGGGDDMEFGILVGGGVHSEDSQGNTSLVRDGFLFRWDGTELSTRSPLRHYEHDGAETAKQERVNALERLLERIATSNPETTALQLKTMNLFGIDWFPFVDHPKNPPTLIVRRGCPEPTEQNAVELRFGSMVRFEYLLAAQYHNGYLPVGVRLLNGGSAPIPWIERCKTKAEQFLRYDHIREVLVVPAENLFLDEGKKLLDPNHPGESALDLVVRTGELLSNDTCIRYVLPPPLPTFQTYLWYAEEDLAAAADDARTLGSSDLADWYFRYACDARSQEGFAGNLARGQERDRMPGGDLGPPKGCQRACEEFCGGVSQGTVYEGELKYLPDPIVTGFLIRFFLDKECQIDAPNHCAMFCSYSGKYPEVTPWRIVLRKLDPARPPKVCVERHDGGRTLSVGLFPGGQVYAQIIPAFKPDCSHFPESPLGDDVIPSDSLTADGVPAGQRASLLNANARVLSFTHAVQRPLFHPVVRSIAIRRFNPGRQEHALASTFHAQIDLHFEQLNVQGGVSLVGVLPTGAVELFALWNDYNEQQVGPSKSIAQKRINSPTGGFVRVACLIQESDSGAPALQSIDSTSSSINSPVNYWAQLSFRSDPSPFDGTRFTDVIFRIRNTSKFYSYFHNGSAPSDDTFGIHSNWSQEYALRAHEPRVIAEGNTDIVASFMPNNAKPQEPKVHKIVALTVRDEDDPRTTVRFRGNRVRIYLDPIGRQATGQDERIGILVSEPAGIYGKHLAPFISTSGRDIVTDLLSGDGAIAIDDSKLTVDEFVLDAAVLEPEYVAAFAPTYDRADLGRPGVIGIVSYTPQFDSVQGLWYFDPEFTIRNVAGQDLHNPFIQLGLVHYQPNSANYNRDINAGHVDSADGFANDFRISAPVLADFFGIYPGRDVRNPLFLFGNRQLQRFTLSGAVSSLYFNQRIPGNRLRSQFVLTIERELTGGIWASVRSRLTTHEVAINGHVVAQSVSAETRRGATSAFHLLLPDDLEHQLPDEQVARGRFECGVGLELEAGQDRGRHRAVVQEVEWFIDDSDTQTWDEIRTQLLAHGPGQVPHLRIKQSMVFNRVG